jgi:uncharacterized protein YndB with AHSA1/START domain
MVATSMVIAAPPERVFAVLADGWSYASWVVGASHIRAVDADWPAVGARLYHQVGPWPLHIKDRSRVYAMEPDRLLEVHVQAWPLGEASVVLHLEPLDDSTWVTLTYDLTAGVGRLVPKPVQSVALKPRSTEMLHRLSDIAQRRTVARP